MPEITAKLVKELRDKTSAGMMDCKVALVESEGDFDKAIETLRKKGQKVAAKRADRHASEGVAITRVNSENTIGIALVLACETDFVAKNDHDKWIEKEFDQVSQQIKKNIDEYRLDFAVNEVYEFFWGKFCDKYIEDCKKSGETSNLHPMLKKILVPFHWRTSSIFSHSVYSHNLVEK